MLVELGHVVLERQRDLLHLPDALEGVFYNIGPALGIGARFCRHRRGGGGVAGHFLHRGVHFIHGCCGLAEALGRLGRDMVRLLYTPGELV